MSVRILATMALLVTMTGCQYGAPPRIPYVHGTTYVEPDGHRTQIQGQQDLGVSAVLPYADGLLVADTWWFEGSVGLAHVRGRERTKLGPCSTGGGVPSADRAQVVWLTLGCPESLLLAVAAVHVADADGSGGWTRELDRHSLLFVVGFLGDAVVVDGWRDPVRVVPESGPVTVVPHLKHAVAVHGTLVAGIQAVVDTATARLLWETPGTTLTSFSPNGRLLVGAQHRTNVLLDARTGEIRATLPSGLEWFTWEDDRHLLAVAYGNEREALVRIGLDGRAELIGTVVDARPYGYTFETQP